MTLKISWLHIYFGYLVAFSLIYSPVLIYHFGFLDDYYNIFQSKIGSFSNLVLPLFQGGRPVYGVMFLAYKLVNNINDLVWLRFCAIAGLAALSTSIMLHCKRRWARSSPVATFLALLIGLIPAFQVYVSWAACYTHPWSAWLAGLSFCALEAETEQKKFFCHLSPSIIISFSLLTISITMYQPTAMIFWCFAAISWLFIENAQSLPKQFFVALSVMGMAMVIDYGLAKLLPEILFLPQNSLHRTALATNIIQKTLWFINEPLVDAFNFPRIVNDKFYAYCVELFTAAGLLIYFFKHRFFIFWKIFIVLALIPLTYLPNLLVQENWASYRAQIALTTLVIIYEVMAVVGWLSLFRIKKYTPAAILMAVIICGWQAHRHVVVEFVKPQVRELMAVDYYIRKIQCTSAQPVYLVPSTWMNSFAPLVRYDEFGLPSSAQPWTLQGMAWLTLKKQHSPLANQLLNARIGHLSQAPSDACIIDFGRALAISSGGNSPAIKGIDK